MRTLGLACLLLAALGAQAQEAITYPSNRLGTTPGNVAASPATRDDRKPPAREVRIVQVDRLGNVQYHRPSWTIGADGRIVENDRYGNRRYDLQQYQLKEGTAYPIDRYGNIEHSKLSVTTDQGRK